MKPVAKTVRILFFKAEVKGHLRRLASGKIVPVRPYHTRRDKKADESHHNNGSHEPGPPSDGQQDVQRQMEAVIARYTLPDGTKAPGWLKAPNGEPTKLTEGQWVQVRTENFKRWFGDWEAAAKAKILQGAPVATLTGHEPPTGGYAEVRKWAAALFHRQGGMARNPQLGAVILDERSVRDSLAHGGANQYKKAAFAAVKDVIEKGVMINSHHEKNEDSFYISAPVLIHEKNNIVTALVHRDVNTQRMYLHSVMAKESLQDRGVSSADAEAPKRSGSTESEGNKRILQELLNFNFADVSKVIDAHGEPLVVYHGTQFGEFSNFHPYSHFGTQQAAHDVLAVKRKVRTDLITRLGESFREQMERGETTEIGPTDSIYPVFLSIKRPKQVKDAGHHWWSVASAVEEKGDHDGLVYTNSSEHVGQDSYLTFSPTQIKSALGNRGTFDPKEAELVKTHRLPSAPRILFFKAA